MANVVSLNKVYLFQGIKSPSLKSLRNMAKEAYKKQVKLLLGVLPEIAKETCFALHSGTAINLFVRDMPRLSVDVDLTYVPFEDRETSLSNISTALERCGERIRKIFPQATATHKKDEAKLIVTEQNVIVKIEVNTVVRGTLSDLSKMSLCARAQKEFEVADFPDVSVAIPDDMNLF